VWLHSQAGDAGKRLDLFLKEKLPGHSRARLQAWIKEGRARVDGRPAKASAILRGGEAIEFEPGELPPLKAEPEDLPLEVLYEDEDVVVVNKPAGVVVHAGAGHFRGTLVNALLHRFGKLSEVGGELRPGVVHRLDKLTSGVLVVARTDSAHRRLAAQFASRKVEKTYLALVHGILKKDSGRIEKPIGRDPARRVRMAAGVAGGREAVTEYRVVQRFARHTLVEVRIGTGRTHQIRVHLASIGHPVAGDRLYGAPKPEADRGRFFLHASRIAFQRPSTGRRVEITAPLPPELEAWLTAHL